MGFTASRESRVRRRSDEMFWSEGRAFVARLWLEFNDGSQEAFTVVLLTQVNSSLQRYPGTFRGSGLVR